jgi:hypothetical protein
MILMTLTIELDTGLSHLLHAALPQLVTDRETTLIVVGGPSDRTAIADAALRSRKRNRQLGRIPAEPLSHPEADELPDTR